MGEANTRVTGSFVRFLLTEKNANGDAYDSFAFTVWDGETATNHGYSEEKTVVIDVLVAVLRKPAEGLEDTDIKICVHGEDPDVKTNDDQLIATLVALPKKGKLYQINVDGSRGGAILEVGTQISDMGDLNDGSEAGCVLFAPLPNHFGQKYDSFTYFVEDTKGAKSQSLRVDINVLPVNDPPRAWTQNVTTAEDTPVVIRVNGKDDIEGSEVTPFVSRLPVHGKLYRMD